MSHCRIRNYYLSHFIKYSPNQKTFQILRDLYSVTQTLLSDKQFLRKSTKVWFELHVKVKVILDQYVQNLPSGAIYVWEFLDQLSDY
jgi:hypothetical protein